MLITCDTTCNMGYFYLMPGRHQYRQREKHLLKKSTDLSDGDSFILSLLKMEYINKPYPEVLRDRYLLEEYQNDMTEDGYMKGVELDLSYKELMNRIDGNAFQLYTLDWVNDNYYLLTLNRHEKALNNSNYICPMNSNQDTYIIFSIDSKDIIVDFEEYTVNQVSIEGLITFRTDLYPLEYLKNIQCDFYNRSYSLKEYLERENKLE